MVSDSGEQMVTCLSATIYVGFRFVNNVASPIYLISELNPFNLSAYGLSARCSTLKEMNYSISSKSSLPSGDQPCWDRISTCRIHTTLPGRTNDGVLAITSCGSPVFLENIRCVLLFPRSPAFAEEDVLIMRMTS